MGVIPCNGVIFWNGVILWNGVIPWNRVILWKGVILWNGVTVPFAPEVWTGKQAIRQIFQETQPFMVDRIGVVIFFVLIMDTFIFVSIIWKMLQSQDTASCLA